MKITTLSICTLWIPRGVGGELRIPICWLWLFCQDIKERRDEDLLVLPTDAVIFEDPSFKVKQNEFWQWDGYLAWNFVLIRYMIFRYLLRNMLKIKKHFSRIMLKLMPNSATLEPNLNLQRFVILWWLCLLLCQGC